MSGTNVGSYGGAKPFYIGAGPDKTSKFTGFVDLFDAEEGRMGVAVTFIAILELLKEAMIEVVQAEEFAPLHVRAASSVHLVADDDEQLDSSSSE